MQNAEIDLLKKDEREYISSARLVCSVCLSNHVVFGIVTLLAMRLSANMATGKGLAAIFIPKNVILIGCSKSNKLQSGILQHCNACQRYFATVALGVDVWNRQKVEKCNVPFSPCQCTIYIDYIIAYTFNQRFFLCFK